MTQETFSVRSHHGSKSTVERAAEAIFTACGFFAVLAVASITLYMIFSGTPALFKVGILDILFGTLWQPAAATPSFWYPVCYPYIHCGNLSGDPDWCAGWRDDSSFPGRSSAEKTGQCSPSGSRAVSRYPVRYLRSVRYPDLKSSDV